MSQRDDEGSVVDSTVWYLELTERTALAPETVPDPQIEITRAESAGPEFGRFLYTAVGGDHFWIDRLPWTWHEWEDWLSQPALENWVVWSCGRPVGYAELRADTDGNVEICSFGLIPGARGNGLGRYLLTLAVENAWTIAERCPGLSPAKRVWLHTCSFDSPAALHLYRSQGFRVYKVETAAVTLPPSRPDGRDRLLPPEQQVEDDRRHD